MKRLLFFSLCFINAAYLIVLPVGAQEQQRAVGLGGAPAGRYYALVIGNNAYVSLQKLKTAEADAREVAALLKESYGFETKLLLNATRQQIMSAFNSYRRELGADANLLVYYAGHGVNDKDADKAYWLPVDATLDDNSNWIIADEITTALKVIPAKHVLVISDSCYSGTLTRGLGEALPRPSEREQFLRRMAAGRSRTLMASGGDEPVADGGGGGHSVFAGALLRGLKQMDKGEFTAGELFRSHVEEAVAGRANQTPEYNPLRNSGHESGDFIFVRLKRGDKTVEVTVNTPSVAKVDPAQQELAFWSSIQNSADAEDFKDYLARYPNGLYAGIARRRLGALGGSPKPNAGAANSNAPNNKLEASRLPDIPKLNALVTALRFYLPTPNDERVYRARFPKAEVSYVNWELNLSLPAQDRDVPLVIDAVMYRVDGSVDIKSKVEAVIPAGWTSARITKGWGYPDPGKWPTETYRVELFVDGQKIAVGTFDVY
ncbi:MAG TPA: caspase family protein [Pyrinomonadaceae bacterium]|nr:caspase family protein [Pyrinomonadaceae bacterium]